MFLNEAHKRGSYSTYACVSDARDGAAMAIVPFLSDDRDGAAMETVYVYEKPEMRSYGICAFV